MRLTGITIVLLLAMCGRSLSQNSGLWTVTPLEYPRMAHTANVQGRVVLSLVVGPDGVPKTIKRKSGNTMLADDVLRQLLSWRFATSSKEWSTNVTLDFVLVEPHQLDLVPAVVTVHSPTKITVESTFKTPDPVR